VGSCLGLLNEPSFIRFIGDRGVHMLDDARTYIRNGPMASYDRNDAGGSTVRRLGAILAAVIALAAVGRATGPAWSRVESSHFVVSGDASPGDVRHVAFLLEMFREVIARVLPGAREVESAVGDGRPVVSRDRAIERTGSCPSPPGFRAPRVGEQRVQAPNTIMAAAPMDATV